MTDIDKDEVASPEEVHAELCKLLTSEWDIEKLENFANERVWVHGGLYSTNKKEFSHLKDFVGDVFEKALSGKRKWYKNRVEFMGFLRGAIKSHISNHFELFEVKKTESIEKHSTSSDEETRTVNLGDRDQIKKYIKEYNNNIERQFATKACIEDILTKTEEELTRKNDKKALAYFEGKADENLNKKEIMERNHLGETEYNSSQKKVNRILKKYKEEFEDQD